MYCAGMFDDRDEAFEVNLSPDPLPRILSRWWRVGPLGPGPHFIAVRATDEDSNMGVEKISLRAK